MLPEGRSDRTRALQARQRVQEVSTCFVQDLAYATERRGVDAGPAAEHTRDASMKTLGKDFAFKTETSRIPETSVNQTTKTQSHHSRTETRTDLDCGFLGCDAL